jgi:UDP-N-acetylmuramate dehydrogenase
MLALKYASKRGCPVFALGGGSNIVVSDSGFPGLALKVEMTGIKLEPSGRISAAAGEEWDSLVKACVENKLAGVECLSGIPGTVGAAPIQNIGAYGKDASEVIEKVCALDRTNLHIIELTAAECHFGYRTSIFNTDLKNRYIILSVEFQLQTNGEPRVRYEELRLQLAGKNKIGLSDVRESVLRIRESKGMASRENDPDSKSVGSFFKNPILDLEKIKAIENTAKERGIIAESERIPRFAASPGTEKISAAWIIEHAGFAKGYRMGQAAISGKHALALINRGGATAQDIINLMRIIQSKAMSVFGIELQPEPVFIGFEEIR